MGRPRKKGKRLPTLNQVLANKQTVWKTVQVQNWYGQGPTQVEIASNTAVWYHSGKPAVPIRWVLVRDPNGKFETKALLCTDPSADPLQRMVAKILAGLVAGEEVVSHPRRDLAAGQRAIRLRPG